MHPELLKYLNIYRKSRNFNAEKWIDNKCKLFNDYLTKYGLKSACVSGGIDSAIVFGLLHHARNMTDSPIKRIVGVAQPIHSSEWSLSRAREVASLLKEDLIEVDQTEIHTNLVNLVDKAIGISGNQFSTGQLRSYMRTPTIYYISQLLTQQGLPCVVMGTGNLDEDMYLGYFSKAGDGCVDIQLIADLHKSEVFSVARALNMPESIVKSAPSADLWEGQTDENEMGFTYDFVEFYTGYYLKLDKNNREQFINSLSTESLKEFRRDSELVEKTHQRNSHKLNGSPVNI